MCSRITSLDFIIIYCNICYVQDFINVVITQNIYLRQVSLCDIYWRQMTMLYLLVTAMLMWYLIKTDINLNFCDIHWRQMSMWYLLKYQCDIYWLQMSMWWYLLRCQCDIYQRQISMLSNTDRYQYWIIRHILMLIFTRKTDINADNYLIQISILILPEIGTLSSTLSAFLIRYRDRATTCWHQKISLFPHPHLTEVILHLWNKTQSSVEQSVQLNF